MEWAKNILTTKYKRSKINRHKILQYELLTSSVGSSYWYSSSTGRHLTERLRRVSARRRRGDVMIQSITLSLSHCLLTLACVWHFTQTNQNNLKLYTHWFASLYLKKIMLLLYGTHFWLWFTWLTDQSEVNVSARHVPMPRQEFLFILVTQLEKSTHQGF